MTGVVQNFPSMLFFSANAPKRFRFSLKLKMFVKVTIVLNVLH